MKKLEFLEFDGTRERIKELRGEMSQKDLSLKLGFGQTYVSEVELGKKPASIKFIAYLALYRNVPTDFILTGRTFKPARPMTTLNQMSNQLNRTTIEQKASLQVFYDAIITKLDAFKDEILASEGTMGRKQDQKEASKSA